MQSKDILPQQSASAFPLEERSRTKLELSGSFLLVPLVDESKNGWGPVVGGGRDVSFEAIIK